MADYSHVPSLEDGYNLAVVALRELVREVLPDHSLILANKGSNVPTTPYVSFRTLGIRGENEGGNNNRPIHYEVRDDESEMYIYQYAVPLSVKVFKDNAMLSATKIRQALNRSDLHYNFFSSTKILGVTKATNPIDEPVIIDMQEWEEGARLEITVSFLAKEIVTQGLGIIKTVEYLSDVRPMEDIMAEEMIEDANTLYGFLNTTPDLWVNGWSN